jgi:hypothetical protein
MVVGYEVKSLDHEPGQEISVVDDQRKSRDNSTLSLPRQLRHAPSQWDLAQEGKTADLVAPSPSADRRGEFGESAVRQSRSEREQELLVEGPPRYRYVR